MYIYIIYTYSQLGIITLRAPPPPPNPPMPTADKPGPPPIADGGSHGAAPSSSQCMCPRLPPSWCGSTPRAQPNAAAPGPPNHSTSQSHSKARGAPAPGMTGRGSLNKSGIKGLVSADRNNKATLPLTTPRSTTKSYAKDLSPSICQIAIHELDAEVFPKAPEARLL